MKTFLENVILLAFCLIGASSCATPQDEAKEVVDIIYKVNNYWQEQNPKHGRSFWDNAAYHTGNMEAFFLTGDTAFMDYSKAWAEHKAPNRTIKPSGNTATVKVMSMCFSVITRFASRRMQIYIT